MTCLEKEERTLLVRLNLTAVAVGRKKVLILFWLRMLHPFSSAEQSYGFSFQILKTNKCTTPPPPPKKTKNTSKKPQK